jgi:hypothetical protein
LDQRQGPGIPDKQAHLRRAVLAVLVVNSQGGALVTKPVLAERVAVEGLVVLEEEIPRVQVAEALAPLPAAGAERLGVI